MTNSNKEQPGTGPSAPGPNSAPGATMQPLERSLTGAVGAALAAAGLRSRSGLEKLLLGGLGGFAALRRRKKAA